MNSTLIRTEMIECPLCGRLHQVELRKRDACVTIKGETVTYQKQYYLCNNILDDNNEYVPARMMDSNLLAARDSYRRSHGMLTSKDLIELRNRYGLTQRELAKLLGWGEATISRYETKLIQDKTYDDILQRISSDPKEIKRYLEANCHSFDQDRYREIMVAIEREIAQLPQKSLEQQYLEALYANLNASSEYTGGVQLDVEKTCNMLAFFAAKCNSLYKVKSMKLLWYTDALSYRENGKAMSGLVYMHKAMGALPVGHELLVKLIPHEEQFESDFEYAQYRIMPTPSFNENVFTQDELKILYRVLSRFGSYTGKALADHMHKEVAYTQTADRAYIPFSLAAEVQV